MKRVSSGSLGHKERRSRLTVIRRFTPGASFLPAFRFLLALILMAALLVGATQFFGHPFTASALEFTTHVVGKVGGQVGVLDEVAADMNGDGLMDIVAAGTGGTRLYTQNKKKVFTISAIDDAAAYKVDLADFDKDGLKDVVISLKNAPGVRWLHNEGGGSFSSSPIGNGAFGLAAVGDLDKDGNTDVVIASTEGGEVVLRRWMNDGNGHFTSFDMGTNTGITAMAIGDVNGDGYPDVVTGGLNGLQRWMTKDGLSWSRVDIDSDNQNKSWIAIGEVTGDDKTDIVTADQSKDLVAVYGNIDNNAWKRSVLDGNFDAATVTLADLNADKKLDIVVASQDASSIEWYQNQGGNSYISSELATGLRSVYGVDVVDLDKDGDLDFIAGDLFKGTLYWYERVRAKPVATIPSGIQQSTSGSGLITFSTTVSDGDRDPTRLRVEYSPNGGTAWYRAAVSSVKVSAGAVDLDNSLLYQIGTKNAVDTNTNDSVKVTITWDTKSVQNLGGAIVGDNNNVKLRVSARDTVSVGDDVATGAFEVDNGYPQGLRNFRIVSLSTSEAQLSWGPPTDGSAFSYSIYYGTDPEAVNTKTADVWDSKDDEALGDGGASNTTIKNLQANQSYTFKLYMKDKFGNETSSPAVAGISNGAPISPTTSPSASTTPNPEVSASPSSTVTPRPTPPLTTFENKVPVADAGLNQVVNPNALVILDGTASHDLDGDELTFVWRELSGPQVDLLSARTATPSFSAGGENQTYIFSLTVRDPKGASSTDIVTVATKALPTGNTIPVATAVPNGSGQVTSPSEEPLTGTQLTLRIFDLLLFFLSLVAAGLSVIDRLARRWRENPNRSSDASAEASAKGWLVHYKTGKPIVGATVLIYGQDGKLKTSAQTNGRGEFPTLFPVGTYSIVVQAEGFSFAPASGTSLRPDQGIVYAGGTFTIQDGSRPIAITIPMKPTGQEISTMRGRFLNSWQTVQRVGRALSWPLFLIGAGLNTFLIFVTPTLLYLVIEVLYVVLVIIKVALEVHIRPAYGVVRDAITHVPLDLAVVRLYEESSNRLVMTRATNAQGKFFALPPAGQYTITVTKPGYAVFSKQGVVIAPDQDSALQLTTDLMPVTPQAGLAAVRSAVL